MNDRSMKAIGCRNCVINYRFGSIRVHVHREKLRKDISEGKSGGNPIKVPEKIENAIEAEWATSSRELLPTEVKKAG